MIIKILGCGHSFGTPTSAGQWNKCNPKNSYEYRTRSSILIEHNDINLLIDAGPDLRQQTLRNNIKSIDHVFITHTHADHFLGINDLQPFAFNKQMNLYTNRIFTHRIIEVFGYCVNKKNKNIILHSVDHDIEIQELGIIKLIKLQHGLSISFGIRIGNFAYCVDLSGIEDQELEKLFGVQLLIIGCIDYIDHRSHAGYDKIMKLVNQINPSRTIITHMNNNMNYIKYDRIEMAYDSMIIDANSCMEC